MTRKSPVAGFTPFFGTIPCPNDPCLWSQIFIPQKAASNVLLKFSEESQKLLALAPGTTLAGSDLLSEKPSSWKLPAKDLVSAGVPLPELPPLSVAYFDLAR